MLFKILLNLFHKNLVTVLFFCVYYIYGISNICADSTNTLGGINDSNLTLSAALDNNILKKNNLNIDQQNEFQEITTLRDIEITYFDTQNKEVKSKLDFTKNKYNLVVFMAKWCPYCILEINDLEQTFEDFKQMNINIIPIFIDLDATGVKNLYKQHNIKNLSSSIYVDKEAEVFYKLNLKGFPNSFLTDSTGEVIKSYPRRYIDWKEKNKIKNLETLLKNNNK